MPPEFIESDFPKGVAKAPFSDGLLIRVTGLISPLRWTYFAVTVALKVRASGLLSPKYA